MNRQTVSMVEGKERLKLSMLKEQKELLRRIGEGNVSAGFRWVLGAFVDAVYTISDPAIQSDEAAAIAYFSLFEPFERYFDADSND